MPAVSGYAISIRYWELDHGCPRGWTTCRPEQRDYSPLTISPPWQKGIAVSRADEAAEKGVAGYRDHSTCVWPEPGQSSHPIFSPFASVNPAEALLQQAPASFSSNVHPAPFLTVLLLCRRDCLSPARRNCLATNAFPTNAVLRGICHYSGHGHEHRWLQHTSTRAVLQELLGWRLHQMMCWAELQHWQPLPWKCDKTKGCANSSRRFSICFVDFLFLCPIFKFLTTNLKIVNDNDKQFCILAPCWAKYADLEIKPHQGLNFHPTRQSVSSLNL